MIIYKPTNQQFETRLEAKIALGTSNFNRLMRTKPDDFLLIENSLATHEPLSYTSRTI